MSGVFCYFLFFFKVKSGVFLHNRVATLITTRLVQGSAANRILPIKQNLAVVRGNTASISYWPVCASLI